MSGEKEGRRAQMERFAASLVKQGNDVKYAKKKAVEMAVRADRREATKKR